jgi:hypothetical protein
MLKWKRGKAGSVRVLLPDLRERHTSPALLPMARVCSRAKGVVLDPEPIDGKPPNAVIANETRAHMATKSGCRTKGVPSP